MLAIENATVRYGSTTVLDGLNWQVGTSGAVVTALLGPSGCGKSTLLRAIAGLEPVRDGRIGLDGVDLAEVPPHRRDFGVVFQDGQLFTGRTVAANVAYGLRMRRRPRAEVAARIEEMLELVRLPDLADRRASELSGGQAQRVALARALAPRPRLLLLDEPLAALDRRLRDRLAVDIAEIVRAARTPTIVVTHDHTEAAMMGDRIAVMRDGEIVQDDVPSKLWAAPVDEWVARFLGVTTIVAATVSEGRAASVFGSVAVDRPDGPVRLGLRPESILVQPFSGGGVSGAKGRVVAVADLPTGRRVRVRSAEGEIEALTTSGAEVGDAVSIELIPRRVAVIDG